MSPMSTNKQKELSLFRRIKVPALIIPRPATSVLQDLKDAESKKPLFRVRES